MSGGSDHARRDAWLRFKAPIVQAAQCVDQTVRLNERELPGDKRLLATPSTGLQFGDRFALTFSFHLLHVNVEGDERMTMRRYTYSIRDRSSNERVFAWHWHPDSQRSQVHEPHYHPPKSSPYSKHHIPTGRVSIEDVILFGFKELNVTPTVPTAEQLILCSRKKHVRYRKW